MANIENATVSNADFAFGPVINPIYASRDYLKGVVEKARQDLEKAQTNLALFEAAIKNAADDVREEEPVSSVPDGDRLYTKIPSVTDYIRSVPRF